MDKEVVGSIEQRHPPLMGAIQRTVLADDQLVVAESSETADELINIGNTVERMHDESQPRSITIPFRQGSAASFVLLDPVDHQRIDGR
jgi:hypothetical protein